MFGNLKKLLSLRNYIYGHLNFLNTIKALNKTNICLGFLLGTLTLVFEGLGVSILVPLLSFIQVEGDIDNGSLMAGQSVSLVKKVQPVKDIFSEIIMQADEQIMIESKNL